MASCIQVGFTLLKVLESPTPVTILNALTSLLLPVSTVLARDSAMYLHTSANQLACKRKPGALEILFHKGMVHTPLCT